MAKGFKKVPQYEDILKVQLENTHKYLYLPERYIFQATQVAESSRDMERELQEQKPLVVKIEGKVAAEPSSALITTMVVELPNPPDEVREYLESVLEDPLKDYPQLVAKVLVGRIKMFKYLFSKD